MKQTNQIPGLYDPSFEHDNCGIGACVNIKGVKNHQTVDNALKIVETLEHRAGKDAAGETGDGVGIMLQISHKFFSKACKAANINIGKEREYGIGMFFFPNDELRLRQAKKMFEIIVEKEGMTFLGWREVPVKADVLGSRRGRSGHGYTWRAGIYLKAALCRPAQDSPPEADMHGRKIFLPENVQGVLIPGFSAYDVKKSSGDSF